MDEALAKRYGPNGHSIIARRQPHDSRSSEAPYPRAKRDGNWPAANGRQKGLARIACATGKEAAFAAKRYLGAASVACIHWTSTLYRCSPGCVSTELLTSISEGVPIRGPL